MKSKRISFLANSNYTYEKIKEAYPYKKVACIPNPIQGKYIVEKREGYGQEKRTGRVFLSICQGLAEKRKNIHTLLVAFQLYRKEDPDASLILAGGYTSAWKQKCERQGLLAGVRFTGAVGHGQVFKLLDRSDALVHPSLEETFGNTLLEAMARGVVCIGGRDAGAVPEVLGWGQRGILCDVTSAASIAEAMHSVENTEYRNRLVDAATGYLKGQYADHVVAAQHIKLYQTKLYCRPPEWTAM